MHLIFDTVLAPLLIDTHKSNGIDMHSHNGSFWLVKIRVHLLEPWWKFPAAYSVPLFLMLQGNMCRAISYGKYVSFSYLTWERVDLQERSFQIMVENLHTDSLIWFIPHLIIHFQGNFWKVRMKEVISIFCWKK